MFSDDFLDEDMAANFFLRREEAVRDYTRKSDASYLYATKTDLLVHEQENSATFATKSELLGLEQENNATFATKTELAEVVVGSGGGLTKPVADTYYAPLTGSTEYATQTALATGLSGKSDTNHTHTGVYQPAGSYATTTDLSNGLAGKSDTSHTHTGIYQPVGSYLVAADIAGKADASDVATALAGKSDTSHTHTGLPSVILTTAAPSGASDTNVYSALECDARFASTAGAGITQTQADTRYLQLTGVKSTPSISTSETFSCAYVNGNFAPSSGSTAYAEASHTHTGVYQPVGNYLTDGSIYQTKANMTVVGSETTYYSGAKVDQLLSALGGGVSPITHLSAKWYDAAGMTIPANTKFLVPFSINNDPNGYGLYATSGTNLPIQYNNTPLTLVSGFWVNSGTDTVVATVSWTLQTYGDNSFVKATWLRYIPTTGDVPTDLSKNIGANVMDTGTGNGSVQHHLGSTTSVRLVPNAKFGIYVQFGTTKALVDSAYNQGVTLNVVCFKM